MKVETKIQLEQRIKNDARQRIKDRINEKMKKEIKNFKNKTKTGNEKDINKPNLQHHVFNNEIKVYTNPQHFNNTKIEESGDFKNS